MKIGRPEIFIDLNELKELMSFYPSLEECAGWFDASPDTVARAIKQETELTFTEFRDRYMAKTKIALKRLAISKALEGNEKMLIHCLKSITNLIETPVSDEKKEVTIKLCYADKDL